MSKNQYLDKSMIKPKKPHQLDVYKFIINIEIRRIAKLVNQIKTR